jgi:hypothetical protein
MHREVPLLYSRARQRARGMIWVVSRPGHLSTFLLSFLLAASASASSVTYTYDELGRLKVTSYDNGSITTYTLDAAGNRKNITATLDTVAPSVPMGVAGTAVSKSQINLSWAKSTDGSGSTLVGYYVYRNGVQVPGFAPAIPTPTFNDTGLTELTNYTYTVAAFDNATPANVSAQSASSPQIRTLDQTAPSPAPAITSSVAVSASQINLAWSGSTDSGTGLAGYQVFRDGTGLTPVGPAVTSFSDTGLAEYTSHTYYVQAFDGATPRNNATSATTAPIFTLDQTPPILQPPLSATATSQSTIGLIWQRSTGDPTPGAGFAGYSVYRNGVAISGLLPIATVTFNDTGLAPATTYNYTLIATDLASPPNSSSLTASATTPSNIPNTPPGTPAPSGIVTTATWTEVWSASAGPVAYYILNKTGGTGPQNFMVTAPATSSAQGGGNGITYQYQVQACNSSGQCSAFGTPVFVTRCNGGVCP